ncbi:MAG: hypothetical protein ABJA94_08810 [Rhodoglobus sp.]
MVISFPRRSVAAVLLAGALLAGTLLGMTAGGAASAATPEPSPSPTTGAAVIHYAGTGTVTDISDGIANSYPVIWTVDCTSSPCTITGVLNTGANETFPLTGGILQQFIGGKGVYSYPDPGNTCDDNYVGPYTITITATGNELRASFDLTFAGDVDCPDGTTITYGAAHVDITAAVTSGDTCYIFAACPTAHATPVPVSAPAPIAPDDTYTGGTAPDAPSTLSTLPTVTSALTPQNAVWAVAMTTVLVILIALPSHLINVALEHGTERLGAWWRRVRPARAIARPKPAASTGPISWTGWPLAAGGVLIASLISSFVSPSFGFNGSSVRVFLSILVSFLLDAVAGWFVVIWLVRRATPTATAGFRFVPATLIIVAAAVLFSRLTGFQPGIVFGLVAGVVFGAALATAEKAKVALVPLVYSFGVAVIGWVAYSVIVAAAGAHPDGVALFAKETFSAMAIAGIAALPIALIPLKGLAGYEVFSWNRWVWGASYAVGLFGFFLVLMPLPFSWQSVSLSIWVWVGIYLAYALAAVLAWLLIVRPWKREAATDTETEPAEIG